MKRCVFFLFFLFFTCGVEKTQKGDIVARVDEEILTKKNLAYLTGGGGRSADLVAREIQKWVEEKLLYNAALSIGLDKDRGLIKKRDLFYKSLLVSSFLEIQKKEKIKITKKEVSNYYLQHKNSFKRVDDEVIVKHIVLNNRKKADKLKKEMTKKTTKKDILLLLGELQAETKTIRRQGAGSNQVGFVFSGVPGDVLGPKKRDGKFHLFHVLQSHKAGSFLGLELVYDEVYQRIYKEKESVVLSQILDSLYLKSEIFMSPVLPQ